MLIPFHFMSQYLASALPRRLLPCLPLASCAAGASLLSFVLDLSQDWLFQVRACAGACARGCVHARVFVRWEREHVRLCPVVGGNAGACVPKQAACGAPALHSDPLCASP